MPPDKELGYVSLEVQNYCPAMDGLTYHFLERKEKMKPLDVPNRQISYWFTLISYSFIAE